MGGGAVRCPRRVYLGSFCHYRPHYAATHALVSVLRLCSLADAYSDSVPKRPLGLLLCFSVLAYNSKSEVAVAIAWTVKIAPGTAHDQVAVAPRASTN